VAPVDGGQGAHWREAVAAGGTRWGLGVERPGISMRRSLGSPIEPRGGPEAMKVGGLAPASPGGEWGDDAPACMCGAVTGRSVRVAGHGTVGRGAKGRGARVVAAGGAKFYIYATTGRACGDKSR
jgi:hypothetical protein